MKTAVRMAKVKVRLSENLGTKMATRLFRGLAVGVLLVAATGLYFSINQGEAGSPLVREQNQCYSEFNMDCRHDLLSPFYSEQVEVYPEFDMVGRYGPLSFEIPEDSAPISGLPLASAQVEVYPEFDMVGRYGPLSFEIPEDPAPVSGHPLTSEQMERLEVYEMMGVPWRIDDQGRVVVVEVRRPLSVDYSLVD